MSDAMRNSMNQPGYLPDEDEGVRQFPGQDPVGTLEEIRKTFPILQPGQVVVCGPDDAREGVRGCKAWKKCPFVDLKGKAGPELGAFQYIRPAASPSGYTLHVSAPMPCWAYPFERKRMRINGGAVRHLAWAGAEIVVPGSIVEDKLVPGQGMVRTHKQGPVKYKIPAFPRPMENQELVKFALIQEQLQVDQDVSAGETESNLLRIARGTSRGPMDPAEVLKRANAVLDDDEDEDEVIGGTSDAGKTVGLEAKADGSPADTGTDVGGGNAGDAGGAPKPGGDRRGGPKRG